VDRKTVRQLLEKHGLSKQFEMSSMLSLGSLADKKSPIMKVTILNLRTAEISRLAEAAKELEKDGVALDYRVMIGEVKP